MKTPKRIAYCSCGCWLNLESGDYMDDKGKFHNSTTLFCPKCGSEYPGEAFAARIIRKNREARLRHALREMKWQIEVKKAQLKGCWSACVTYRKAVSASGTFFQDIEGS